MLSVEFSILMGPLQTGTNIKTVRVNIDQELTHTSFPKCNPGLSTDSWHFESSGMSVNMRFVLKRLVQNLMGTIPLNQ